MLKEAIEKITELAQIQTFNIDGHTYASDRLNRIDPPVDRPKSIPVTGLDSICKLIREELGKVGTTVFIQVEEHDTVRVFTTFLDDFSRNDLYQSKADVPGIKSGYREHETALIELRSLFMPNDGTQYLLDLLSKMSKDNSVSSSDNGVTQTVEMRQGIALKSNAKVNPRVSLKPFRTFLEVDQPESEFLLRIDEDGRIGLFEADGGVWKLEAKQNISKYFENQLKDLIDDSKVIVMQ